LGGVYKGADYNGSASSPSIHNGPFWIPNDNRTGNYATSAKFNPAFDQQTGFCFPLINRIMESGTDARATADKIAITRLQRQLVGPHQIELVFTGKGLDFHPLSHVRTDLNNAHLATKFTDQSTLSYYSTIASSPILSDEATYMQFLSHSFELEPGSDTKLSKRSSHLPDFLPAFYSIKHIDSVVFGSVELSQKKVQLAQVLEYVSDHHCLLRDPFVFAESFAPVINALKSPTHECRKDLYSITSLMWFLEIRLAHFYRRVQLLRGPSDPHEMRTMFALEFTEPFVNLTGDMLTQFVLDKNTQGFSEKSRSKQAEPIFTVTIPSTPEPPKTALASTSSPSLLTPPPIKLVPQTICKFGLAEALKVPYPNSSNIPTCKHTSPCPVKAHPDYGTISKDDLVALITASKEDFKGPTWLAMYEPLLAAARVRA
jgi:hypothetical protein